MQLSTRILMTFVVSGSCFLAAAGCAETPTAPSLQYENDNVDELRQQIDNGDWE